MLYVSTLEELKANLGIPDVRDDVELTTAAEGLQGRFDGHLNRTLLRGEGVEEIKNGGVTALELSRYPVESIASVHLSEEQVWDETTLMAATHYIPWLERGLVYRRPADTMWPRGRQCVRVVYTGGYSAGAIPDAIRHAFFLQFGFEWRNRKTLGSQSVSAGGASVSLAPAKFLPEVTESLIPFVRM